MSLNHLLPFISTAITFIFALSVFNRYRVGRKPYTLMWGIGLTLYGIGTLTEAYLAIGWSELALRLWYLSGAMLTAAWLGQGTVFLLVRKPRVAASLAIGLAVVSLIAVAAVFTTSVNSATFQAGVPISSQYQVLLSRSSLMKLLVILLNIYGTLTLVGGAVWSAWLFARKRVLPNRVWGSIFIAVGGLLPATAGTLILLHLGDWLYVSELFGAALMFLGFWLATQPETAERPARAAIGA